MMGEGGSVMNTLTDRYKRGLFDRKVWIPRLRSDLVKWLSERYPEDKVRFEGMRKKQLYAIYFKVRGIYYE